MKRALSLMAVAAACCLASVQAGAKDDPFVTKAVADKPVFAMVPGKAYILVEAADMANLALARLPSPADLEKDKADRAEALTREHGKWVKRHAAWQSQMRTLAKSPSSVRRPVEPLEPTEENFGWLPYEQRHVVFVGPMNRFAKLGASLYLQEVPPGEYLYYGNVVFNPNGGVIGTCACMGTVAFNAEPGKITVLGKVNYPLLDAARSEPKEQRPKDAFDLPPGTTTLRILPATPVAADTRLSKAELVPASFRPVPRVGNWYGLEIDRLMAMDGVFRYEGDRMIDAKPAS